MANLSSLKELDNFKNFKQYIKEFIMTDEILFRLIYFCNKNPLDENICQYPENPYEIFENKQENEDDTHGVVLFRKKDDEILNYGTTIVLVDFESARLGTSQLYDDVYIIFRIICKSSTIQELEDSDGNVVNRINAIAERIDNNFNLSKINDIGRVRRQSYQQLPLNEENGGMIIIYKTVNLSTNLLDNKNYLQRTYGVDSREYL